MFPVQWISLLCWREIFSWNLQGWSWRRLTLSSCSLTRCWNESLLRLGTSATIRRWRCKAHLRVENIEPWQSSTTSLRYRHSADHAPAGGVLTAGSCCPPCLERALACTGVLGWRAEDATCWLLPSARTTVPGTASNQRCLPTLCKWKIISICRHVSGVGGLDSCYM